MQPDPDTLRQSDTIILIYQMGKVGSGSILRSLRRAELPFPVLFCHTLNPDYLKKQVATAAAQNQPMDPFVNTGLMVGEAIAHPEGPQKTWKLVSLVRDPVARNISAFFQNIDLVIPDFLNRYQTQELTIQDVIDRFFKHYNHRLPLDWFDLELKAYFEVDVFSMPFPHDQGYLIHRQSNIELLLIRLENLTPPLTRTMFQEFLGMDRVRLRKANVGDRKAYADAYQEFRTAIQLPESYLDQMYASKYVNHFYRPQEIQSFREKWQKK